MNYKKITYVCLTIFLGIVCSTIIHTIAELLYLRHASQVTWYQYFGYAACSLPPIVVYSLVVVGGIAGYLLGLVWWKIVYVEKRSLCKRKKGTN